MEEKYFQVEEILTEICSYKLKFIRKHDFSPNTVLLGRKELNALISENRLADKNKDYRFSCYGMDVVEVHKGTYISVGYMIKN